MAWRAMSRKTDGKATTGNDKAAGNISLIVEFKYVRHNAI